LHPMLQGKSWDIILKHGFDAWVYGDDWHVRNVNAACIDRESGAVKFQPSPKPLNVTY